MSRKLELECGGKCTQDYLSNWVQNAEFCYTDQSQYMELVIVLKLNILFEAQNTYEV